MTASVAVAVAPTTKNLRICRSGVGMAETLKVIINLNKINILQALEQVLGTTR